MERLDLGRLWLRYQRALRADQLACTGMKVFRSVPSCESPPDLLRYFSNLITDELSEYLPMMDAPDSPMVNLTIDAQRSLVKEAIKIPLFFQRSAVL